MKKFNELTTEEKWDIVYEIIHDIDENYKDDKYKRIYVNIYQDTDGDNILVFDDWDSEKKFNNLIIEKLKENEIDISFEENVAGARNDKEEYFVNRLTDDACTFSDEGFVCSDCDTWYYYDNNCGCGYANYFVGDGFIVCENCLENNEEYMEIFLSDKIDNPKKANTILSEDKLKELGFEKINEHYYENGWYGDNDQPSEILEKAKEKFPEKEFIFNVRKIYNPFTTQFDLYGRDME